MTIEKSKQRIIKVTDATMAIIRSRNKHPGLRSSCQQVGVKMTKKEEQQRSVGGNEYFYVGPDRSFFESEPE